MKTVSQSSKSYLTAIIWVLMIMASITALAPSSASAATGANATVWNVVDVSWGTGSATYHRQATVAVTVATLAATPNLYAIPSSRTVAAGAFASYSTAVQSAANGSDTYDITAGTPTINNMATNGSASSPTSSVTLFGSIISSVSGVNGTINLPGGSVTANQLQNKFLVIGGNIYKVTSNTAGNAASGATTNGTALPATAEQPAVVTLAAVSGGQWGYPAGLNAAGIAAIGAGTQVGEVIAVNTLGLTVGTPDLAGSGDGTYASPYTFTSRATLLDNTTKQSNTVTFNTTVSIPKVTIAKWFKTITDNSGAAGSPSTSINPADPAGAGFFQVIGSSAGQKAPKPGEYIEYLIVLRNTHGSATASNNTVTDPTPAYTTYEASSTYVAADVAGGASRTLSAVTSVTSVLSGGYNAGSISAGNYTLIVYKVKVN